MKKYLSIKYKLILILTLTITFTLLGYYLLATKLFEDDKIAYVYSTILNQVSSREHDFDTVLNQQQKILDEYTMLLQLGDSQNLRKILESRLDILAFKCEKYNFVYLKNDFKDDYTQNIEKEVIFDSVKKNVRIFKTTSADEGCVITINVAQLFETSNIQEGNVSFFIPSIKISGAKERNLIKKIREKIISKNLHSGVKEINDNEMIYLLSFTRINSDLYFVHGIPKEVAIQSIIELKKKSFFYFMTLVSLVGLISIFVANKFSLPILDLTEKVTLFGNGKFNVRTQIDSNDELGKMAKVFNEMAVKISSLVEEVRVYSTQLELIVAQRTSALKRALGLQKAMINSLEQGFFMVNNKLQITGTYSKSAEIFFGKELEGKSIEKILKFEKIDENGIKSIFKHMFTEAIPFESLIGLSPKIFKTSDRKTISLQYEAVRNKEEKIIGLVVISTDKTEAIRLESELENNKSTVFMILKIVNNRYAFDRLLSEVKSSLELFESSSLSELSKSDIFRFAHTMKGSFLLFHMRSISSKIHLIEEEIKNMKEYDNFENILRTLCLTINDELEVMAVDYPFIFENNNWRETRSTKMFFEEDLIMLLEKIKKFKNLDLDNVLREELLYSSFTEILKPLLEDIYLHAKQVGKKLGTIKIRGGECRVNPKVFSVHVQHILHLTRNSIDHGIELPCDRLTVGKEEEGELVIELNSLEKDWHIISIIDDGKGLNPEVLIKKANELGIDISSIHDEDIFNLIFHPGFSTAENDSETAGRGIGMSAIKEYIENLNGKIVIASVLGRGVKITLFIPTISLEEGDSNAQV